MFAFFACLGLKLMRVWDAVMLFVAPLLACKIIQWLHRALHMRAMNVGSLANKSERGSTLSKPL